MKIKAISAFLICMVLLALIPNAVGANSAGITLKPAQSEVAPWAAFPYAIAANFGTVSTGITDAIIATAEPSNGTPPIGLPPNGTPPIGPPPGDGSGPLSYTLSGVYTLDGGSAKEIGKTLISNATNVSGVYVTNGSALRLINPAVITSGDTTSQEASSFYGLNAGVLANNASTVAIVGGTVTTSGTGANGVFSSGPGTSIRLSNVRINATSDGGHGVDATLDGSLILDNVDITTYGAHGAPIATDRGGGNVTVRGGMVTSSGIDSPGIYSTGVITVYGGKITATGAEAAVIEGKNSITLTGTKLGAAKGTRDRGIMLYQSMSGDAEPGVATFAMTGGSYKWPSTTGPAFYVTNTNAVISLKGVAITSASGTLLDASAGSWGNSGSNGGKVAFTADDENLTGNLTSDSISAITAVLRGGTTLTGAINSAAMTLDSTSKWIVTGDSTLTCLNDASGISGTTITNIVGNGHSVYYDASLAANSALGGKTYTLANGGQLIPK